MEGQGDVMHTCMQVLLLEPDVTFSPGNDVQLLVYAGGPCRAGRQGAGGAGS